MIGICNIFSLKKTYVNVSLQKIGVGSNIIITLLSGGYFEYVTISVIKHAIPLIINPLIDYLNLINFNLHPSMQVNA